MKKLIRWLGFIAIVGVLSWRLDEKQLIDTVWQIQWSGLVVALGLLLFAQVISSRRWQMLARPLGFEQPLYKYFSLYLIGMFFNLILPTSVGGDVVRGWYLDGRSGRGWRAFLSVFAERLSGLAVLVVMACVGACVTDIPEWMRWSTFGIATLFFSGGAVMLALARYAPRDRIPFVPAFIESKLRGPLGTCRETIHAYAARPVLLVRVTILSLLVQVASVLQVYALSEALGLNVPCGYYFVVVPLISLLMLLPLSVNGMGLREGGLIVMLAPFAVKDPQAVTLGLLWFSVHTLTGLAGAGFYLLGQFPRYQGANHAEPVGRDSDQGREGQLATAA